MIGAYKQLEKKIENSLVYQNSDINVYILFFFPDK